jgi:pseudouridine synthase
MRTQTPTKKQFEAGYSVKPKLGSRCTVRINKHMADMGMASRREADEMILAGKVFVNGKKATPGMQIDPIEDKVELKGKKTSYVYYAYNKPIGIVTTGPQGDEEDILNATKFRVPVFPIGRLDKDSHGLIIMTNDRRITHRLLDPKFEHEKEYRVTLAKGINQKFIDKLEHGMIVDKVRTLSTKVTREADRSFRIILKEGRNRQIRKMVEAAGDKVVDLIRLRIEHIKLDNLQDGSYRNLTKPEITALLKKLGLK